MKKSKKFRKILFYTLSTILVIIWMVPFFIAIFTSLKTMDEISMSKNLWSPPKVSKFNNYIKAWKEANIEKYFRNTLIITIPATLGALFLSTLSAYAIVWLRLKYSKLILMIFIGGMLIPFQMLLIPVYKLSIDLGIYDRFIGIILFHVAFQLGFCTFFIRNFMITIPKELVEAAYVDGAKHFTIYKSIILPLVVPALSALGILEFTWIWNDYLWALVLIQSDAKKPITLGLVNIQGEWISSWNILAAASILAAVIPIIVFLMFQRYFIEGLTMGSVKG